MLGMITHIWSCSQQTTTHMATVLNNSITITVTWSVCLQNLPETAQSRRQHISRQHHTLTADTLTGYTGNPEMWALFCFCESWHKKEVSTVGYNLLTIDTCHSTELTNVTADDTGVEVINEKKMLKSKKYWEYYINSIISTNKQYHWINI